MNTAINEKCADEAINRNELLSAAKDAAYTMNEAELMLRNRDCLSSAAFVKKCRTRLEVAIKAEEGAK